MCRKITEFSETLSKNFHTSITYLCQFCRILAQFLLLICENSTKSFIIFSFIFLDITISIFYLPFFEISIYLSSAIFDTLCQFCRKNLPELLTNHVFSAFKPFIFCYQDIFISTYLLKRVSIQGRPPVERKWKCE